MRRTKRTIGLTAGLCAGLLGSVSPATASQGETVSEIIARLSNSDQAGSRTADPDTRLFYPAGPNGPARRIFYSTDQGFTDESVTQAGLWEYLTPARIVHPNDLWRIPGQQWGLLDKQLLPDRHVVRELARQQHAEAIMRGDRMVLLNIEHWQVTTHLTGLGSEATADENARKLRKVLDWYREGWPGAQFGMFSTITPNYGNEFDDKFYNARIVRENVGQYCNIRTPWGGFASRGLYDAVDALHFNAYPTWERYGRPGDGLEKYCDRIRELAKLARQVDKPAFLWLSLWYPDESWVEPEMLEAAIRTGLEEFDGVVIWGGARCDRSVYHDANDPPKGCALEYRPGTVRAAWFDEAIMNIAAEWTYP